MRKVIKEFVQICTNTLPISEPIYEFGSFQVELQEGFADLRPLFPKMEYIGADLRFGAGVDVILDLHDIELPTESIGTCLIIDTLEHVEFPRIAIEEAYRILKPNGILILTSTMNFPIHDYPYDYWRFTPEAFKSLLVSFESVIVDTAGEKNFPHTIIGIGYKGILPSKSLENFQKSLNNWKQYWEITLGTKWKEYWDNTEIEFWRKCLISLTPPILIHIYKSIRRSHNR